MAQNPRQPEAMKQWGEVVVRAWSDDTYKQRLLTDPKAVLAEAGLPVPPDLTVQVHKATPTHLHLVLPPPPRDGELSDGELDQVAGGQGESTVDMDELQVAANQRSQLEEMLSSLVSAMNSSTNSMARNIKG